MRTAVTLALTRLLVFQAADLGIILAPQPCSDGCPTDGGDDTCAPLCPDCVCCPTLRTGVQTECLLSSPSPSANVIETRVMQGLGAPGRRSARIDGAEADVSREVAASEDLARRHLQEVAETFLRALHAEERLGLMRASMELAQGIAHAAERRFQAGDVAVLDVALAGAALARALSEACSAGAERVATLGQLRILLGVTAEEPLAAR